MTARQPSVPNLIAAVGSWLLAIDESPTGIVCVSILAYSGPQVPTANDQEPTAALFIPISSASFHPDASPLCLRPVRLRAWLPAKRLRSRLQPHRSYPLWPRTFQAHERNCRSRSA